MGQRDHGSLTQGDPALKVMCSDGRPDFQDLDSDDDSINDVREASPTGVNNDVNGDGLDDLYLCQEEGLPNRLYIQNPDGSVSDKSVVAGVDWIEGSRAR